jgi:uncharacterized protein
MRLSRFTQTSTKDGLTAVFHALHPRPFFVEAASWNRFTAGESDEDIMSALHDSGLLTTIDEDIASVAAVENKSAMKDTMSILYLVMTKKCNFRCRQCFQPERQCSKQSNEPFMTEETARVAIDCFIRHLKMSECEAVEPQIQFYGGEPLLNWPVLRSAVLYANERITDGSLPNDTKLVIVTNGSLVTAERAAFFAAHNVYVGLSVDGPRSLNDSYRHLPNGSGTYEMIKRALALLQEANVVLSLSVTITPAMVMDLPSIIRWAHDEMMVQALSFNLIGDSSLERLNEMERHAYAERAASGLVEAHRVARALGMTEDRMERKVNDFADGMFKYADCGALGNQLVVNPNGDIAFCHADGKYVVGNVSDASFNMFNVMRDHEWHQALPINNVDCHECAAISICGYGCFHHVVDRGLPTSDHDDVHCLHTKAAMEYLIWSLYDKTIQDER